MSTREQEIRAHFREAIGHEVSTRSHVEECKECDDGTIEIRTGSFGEVVEYHTCFVCDGDGEVEVPDDPKWGWVLQMELDGGLA